MKILVGLAFGVALAVAGPASAQTYACQHTDSNGFMYEDGNWRPTGFKLNDPFFIKMVDGKIDRSSIEALDGGTCDVNPWSGTHLCSDIFWNSALLPPQNQKKAGFLTCSGLQATIHKEIL